MHSLVGMHDQLMSHGPDGDQRGEREDGMYPKEAIAATFRKINRFNDRLGAIRTQLAERRQGQLRLPVVLDVRQRNNTTDDGDGGLTGDASGGQMTSLDGKSYEPITLPRLPNAIAPTRVTEPSFDGRLLAMDALRSRERSKLQYDSAWRDLQRAEKNAAASVQEAERLTEEARIAMVLHAKNERSWNFDERARRYQQVMQAKKEAEGARLKADDDRIMVQCQRSQLDDPYRPLRSRISHVRGQVSASTLDPIISSPNQDTVYVWILASPLLTLPFTPRDSTPGAVLTGEKELSTHVVYYAAPSAMPVSAQDNGGGIHDDNPPSDGWVSCSNHGVTPPPAVAHVKSSIETWLVSDAGAAHLNGKYLFSGTHNGTRKFKSAAGIELFRKLLPKTSRIIRGVFDASAYPVDEVRAETSVDSSRDQLPSTLRALERNDNDFKSMAKVGAWMGADTILQKRRRLRDAGSDRQVDHQDGDHVLTQETSIQRLDATDVVLSRPEASVEICREWVLFMRCSRRVNQPLTDAPPQALGLGCLKRHYYISSVEKETMTTWAHEQEAWLEKDVLFAIIRRESYVERVSRSCKKCMSKFQQDLRDETEAAVSKILRELNTIRFLTVKVLETIEAWRSHARQRGFTRFDSGGEVDSSRPSTLGWSASITVNTGKKLFMGSHTFVSKFKRFCRPVDPHGQAERRLVYLGNFSTRDEAELAYDEFANAEARRLNTTVAHLPRRRNVFRSCGKHFSVESERLGPDYCIECAGKQLSTRGTAISGASHSDEWNPPFFFPSGQNYILKLANDLDFLDQVPPLKNRLSHQPSSNASDFLRIGVFPLLGNVFLLPRTPIDDPDLVFFTSLSGSGSIPRLHGSDINNQLDENDEVLEEALDVDRILTAQQSFVQEMQIYHPELFQRVPSDDSTNQLKETRESVGKQVKANPENARRIVQALYWDRCAALRIEQERAPLPFRQPNVWCRPDGGEWASFLVRGKHQQHVLFENRLAKAGKETQERRKKTLKLIRKLLKTPTYFIPSTDTIRSVIAEGEHVKGDVVLLEVKSAYKLLDKYDTWCSKAGHVQRWYRGVRGRRRTRATQRALYLAVLARQRHLEAVNTVSVEFYTQAVVPSALSSATRKLRQPAYSRTVMIDGEVLILSIHAATDSMISAPALSQHGKSTICRSCARRFHVMAKYEPRAKAFQVALPVCCCSLNSPENDSSESWMIRAYNPLSNVIYRLVIQNQLVTQLLQSQWTLDEGTGANALRKDRCNPLSKCMTLAKSLEGVTSFGNYIDALATRAFDKWTQWRILSDEATQRRKTAEIDLKRARERVVDLAKSFDIAIGDARRALDFASRPFGEAQAWDPLENANDWRLLVQKRHTQKELASAVDHTDQCRFDLFQAKASENYLRVESMQHRVVYDTYWKPLVEEQHAVVNALTMELETYQASAVRVMARVCTAQLALRDTFLAPMRRALVVAPAVWRRADLATSRMLMVAVPGLVRGRNTIRRGAMKLSDLSNRGVRRSLRFIVDVSAWTTRPTADAGAARNIWITAYDPATARSQRVYLDWELVQLLATVGVIRCTQTSERDQWMRIADKLMSLCILDRFTGEFTLQKLRFYHHLQLLRPQFLASRWFQDLKRGRKCGDGDEIFRQSVTIGGKLCVAVVYENWGDLVVRVYRSSSARMYHLRLAIDDVFKLLSHKPLALHLWVCCLKSNHYGAAVVTTILRFVRFSSSGDELVAASHLDSSSPVAAMNPLCMATKIQQRRVLLRFREFPGGDLEVQAYDMTSNQSFHLQLEWDNIRHVLKSSDQTGASSCGGARRRNLTLTRNQRELCEWIASRLHFQSLLEHPDVLASSLSPLVSGVQVRTSFQLFNEWIASSTRNPLCEIPEIDIDRVAAAADARLFHGLAHEQLAFVAQARLPCSYDKTLIETRDFILNGNVASGLSRSARHLKVDLYVKAHHLYARVRREIEQEIITRHEREERQFMEEEEVLALRLEIRDACETTGSELSTCVVTLRTTKQSIVERMSKTELVFHEIMKRLAEKLAAQGKKKPAERRPKAQARTRVDAQVDAKVIVSELLALSSHRDGDGAYAIVVRQRFGFAGTLRDLLDQVEKVEAYLDVTLLNVGVLCKSANAVIQQDASLLLLQSTRLDLLGSHRNFSPLNVEDEPRKAEHSVDEKDVRSAAKSPAECAQCVFVGASSSEPALAFVLVASGAMEEVILERSLVSTQSFSDVSFTVRRELASIFQRSASGRKGLMLVQLHAKRVPLGLVVFDKRRSRVTSTRSCPWNTRATALAGEAVAGVAVFIPNVEMRRTSTFHDADSLFRWLTAVEPSERLRKSRPSSSSITAARRRTVQRAKQLLPWKQLSVERMQTARRLRQQRMRLGLRIRQVDDDHEREQGTLATYKTSGHHIEWFVGSARGAQQLDTNALATLVDALRMRRTKQWTLTLEGENQLQLLFDEQQRTRLVPSELPTSELRFAHVRIEADDWRHPKRLIFSCHELQSRQQYFVDCLFSQLIQKRKQDTAAPCANSRGLRFPLAEARLLAQDAVNKLIFCRKNGAIGLHFATESASTAHAQFAFPQSASESAEMAPSAVTPRKSSQQEPTARLVPLSPLRIRELELQRVVRMCRWRRIMKHQRSIRKAAAARQREQAHVARGSRQLPLEWLRMTEEDWFSQENRGILTLDEKEVKKLVHAFDRVYQRRLSEGSSRAAADVAQWFMDVDKEMGVKDSEKNDAAAVRVRYARDTERFISAMEHSKWWREKHAKDEQLALDVVDIAEWWRQREEEWVTWFS